MAASQASQLPFGWVCFSNLPPCSRKKMVALASQLPFGWVCFSNTIKSDKKRSRERVVSIAFRLGLFL